MKHSLGFLFFSIKPLGFIEEIDSDLGFFVKITYHNLSICTLTRITSLYPFYLHGQVLLFFFFCCTKWNVVLGLLKEMNLNISIENFKNFTWFGVCL